MAEYLKSAICVVLEMRLIEVGNLLENELHDIGSIHRVLPLVNSNVDLTLDKIHDINLKPLTIRTGKECLVAMVHEVDKSSTDSIRIPGLRCNAPDRKSVV